MSETVVHEDDDVRVVESTTPDWDPKAEVQPAGAVRSVRTEAKPGGRTALRDARQRAAVDRLRSIAGGSGPVAPADVRFVAKVLAVVAATADLTT